MHYSERSRHWQRPGIGPDIPAASESVTHSTHEANQNETLGPRMKATSASLAALSALFMTDLHAAPSGNSTVSLGDVYITSDDTKGAPRTDSILTSVDIMGSDKIEDKHVMNSWELLGQM